MKKSLRLKKSTSVLGDAFEVLASLPIIVSMFASRSALQYEQEARTLVAFSRHVTMQENWTGFRRRLRSIFYGVDERDDPSLKAKWKFLVFGSYHNIYTLGVILQQLDRRVLNSII